MESLVPIIIFLVILALSGISRLAQKQRLEDKERSQGRTRPQDLPERTRRMIYGDSVPTARPRQPGGEGQEPSGMRPEQPAPTAARPMELRDLMDAFLGERSSASRRAEPPPIGRIPEEVRRPAVPPERPRVQPQARPQPVRRHARPPAQRVAQPKRQPAPIEGQRPQPKPLAQAQRPPERPPAPRRVPARRCRLLAGIEEVRRGIILSEILGPPKALRM